MEDKSRKVELFALSTMKSLVAHRLYVSLGYQDVLPYGWGKKIAGKRKYNGVKVTVKKRSDEEIYRLFRRFSKGALGFVHRHPKFIEPRCTWFPYITNVCKFYRGDKAVGYTLTTIGPKSVAIREICAPKIEEFSSLIDALERKYPGKTLYCMVHGRDDIINTLEQSGLAPTIPSFGVLMMRRPKGKSTEKGMKKLVGKSVGKFQFTSTDEY